MSIEAGKSKEYDFLSFFFLRFLIVYKQYRLRRGFGDCMADRQKIRLFYKKVGREMQALGMIETKGYCAIVEAADTMLKTSGVRLVSMERIGSSLLTVMVVGDVGAVEAAVQAGCEHAKKLGDLIAYKVIPRPHDEVAAVLPSMAKYFEPVGE